MVEIAAQGNDDSGTGFTVYWVTMGPGVGNNWARFTAATLEGAVALMKANWPDVPDENFVCLD